MLELKSKLRLDRDTIESANLTNKFSDDELDEIGELVWEGYERDLRSRFKWLKRTEAAMDLAMQIQKEKSFPWPNCSNVVFPLLTIAALEFSARSYTNIIQGLDVVKYRVVGADKDGTLQGTASRISNHMSWQVLEEDTAWEEQHDRLLINISIVGTAFVKSRFSPILGHNVSELVLARDLVLDYWSKSVETAARKTHKIPLYRNEIRSNVLKGIFSDVREEEWFCGTPAPPESNPQQDNRQGIEASQPDQDTPFMTLEQHRYLDLDGDGYEEPYIITIEEKSHEVLRIVCRFEREEDIERTSSDEIISIKPMEYFTKYGFVPAIDGGIYDIGFGTLIGPLNESVNSGINQLLDAGTMQNSMGGFLGRGTKIRGGIYTMAPWEWKRVDSTGDDLRKNLVPFPERQPSLVMFQLLQLLINYTNRLAGTVDQMVGENPGQNTPAETSRNTLEQGMQLYNVIFKRIWRSMKEEFKKLHRLNSMYLQAKQHFGSGEDWVTREDYKSNADLVVPAADPNVVSKSLRVYQAAAVAQRALMVPGYDVQEVERHYLKALGVDELDKFYPGADKVPPLPNPKMAVENLKMQIKQMDLEQRKFEFIHELSEQRRLNSAKIAQLEAQAISLVADADAARAGVKINVFDLAIKALQAHNQMIDSQIEKAEGDKDGGKDKSGGVRSLENPSSNQGGLSSSKGVEQVSGGAMDGGGIPE